MDAKDLVKKIDDLLSNTIESLGFELIEVEYLNEHGSWILRLYIDSPGGKVTLGDCTKVSRTVSSLMDVEDVVPGKYNLEVSSPGIDRPLRKPKDFKKYEGSVVKIKTYQKIEDQKNFKGVIEGVDGDTVTLAESGKTVKIPINNIYKARLQDAS